MGDTRREEGELQIRSQKSSADDWECCRCGACCEKFAMQRRFAPDFIEFMTAFYGRRLEESIVHVNRRCSKLRYDDDGKAVCTIYDERPKICRDFNCDKGVGPKRLVLVLNEGS